MHVQVIVIIVANKSLVIGKGKGVTNLVKMFLFKQLVIKRYIILFFLKTSVIYQ